MDYKFKVWEVMTDRQGNFIVDEDTQESVLVATFRDADDSRNAEQWEFNNVVRAASGFNRFSSDVPQGVFQEALKAIPR